VAPVPNTGAGQCGVSRSMRREMKVLFVGDVIGRPGRMAVGRCVPALRERYGLDCVIANAENAAGGIGATPKVLTELLNKGVDLITLGNHTWKHRDLVQGLDRMHRVVRPANYAQGVPGRGATVLTLDSGVRIGVVNLLGRVYLEPCECPFRAAEREVEALRRDTPVVFLDFHAEATSEKIAMGWHLNGRCSAVLGTHTHVQTADECVLPGGTAYITDVGMTGPVDSVLGIERERVVKRFLTGMPTEFRVAKGPVALCGVVVTVDEGTGQAQTIERVREMNEAI